jgi:Kdo2-lipid IVA lauroyltransferase/acyltransferase
MKTPPSHFFEFALLRLLESFIACLPRKLVLALGSAIGTFLFYAGVYRKVVKKNMDYTGFITEKNQPALTKRLYKNMGKMFADFLKLSTMTPPYEIDHFDQAKEVFARGKGGIVVLGHFGNWEVLATVFGLKLYDLNVLAKPMHNRLVEKWLFEKRARAHVTPLYAHQALRKMLLILKRGGIIAMLIDQYSEEHGTPSLFLGKPANTIRTVAGMLHKTDCGIIFANALLEKNGTYRIHIEKGPDLNLTKDNQENFIKAYQQAHNDVLSQWIKQHPDHYFGWFHRRFKDTLTY